MIFVTVGTDMPFDRMIRVVDQWASENDRTDVFAQIGEKGAEPAFLQYSRFLDPAEFNRRFATADLIVSHAGMGTILSALRFGKPILVMPRRASLGEQRNEHQLATAHRLQELGKIEVAFDESELRTKLDCLDGLEAKERIGAFASEELLRAVGTFIRLGETGIVEAVADSTCAKPRACRGVPIACSSESGRVSRLSGPVL